MDLVERVKRILRSPRTEWDVIDAEPTTPAGLYTGYIMPLAAIGPVARIIGYSVFGTTGLMGTYRVPIGSGIASNLLMYVLTLGAAYVLAVMIDGLAPTFKGQRNQNQALKLVAYSGTAFWVGGIVMLVPPISSLMILAILYSLYLLYLGLPKLMKTPPEKTLGYTAVVTAAVFVLFLVVNFIAGRFMPVPTAAVTVP
jgi:Yip1-like protein